METSSNRQVVMEGHYSCWKKSGISKKAYCDQHGLGYHTFLYWVAKIIPAADAGGSFSQIALNPDSLPSTAQIEIEYPTGTRIRLQGDFTAAYIKSLL
jgi:hypothetical protein